MKGKTKILSLLMASLIFASCSNVKISADASTTNYVDTTTASANAVIAEDLYENFAADGTVYINFDGTTFSSNVEGDISKSEVSIKEITNSEEKETSSGVEIQYKGTKKIKYVLSGNFTGTVFIKNKNADAAVVLNNINITSDNGSGPVLRFSSEKRTFIVVPENTENTLTDTRVLNQDSTMYDDKKGSVYSKGTLIFTGETSTTEGGTLNITNTGYKHTVYSKDYVRIANLTLNITAESETSRDCIRTLNAVIIDGGNINLIGSGTLEDDESNGIRIDGEDADDDDMTVEYTAGAGFVIINGGKLNITTVAKGITAHWKTAKSVIGNSSYTATANNSLLCDNFLNGTTETTPVPYVEINGGIINITTTGEPYEGQTDDDPGCSPEGIEAKGNLTINAGTITVQTTDDSINAGGNIVINGGAIYVCSSKNDAMDANGSDGITINGGVVIAIGLNMPECGFDCDNNPFTINGGYVVGLGTDMYTAPTSGSQSTLVLASSSIGSADSTMAVVDKKGNPVFVYTLPSSTGSVLILSSPEIKADTEYTIKTGVTVKDSSSTKFHNLYTTLPKISGGTSSLSEISTSSSNMVYTDSNAGSGFGNFDGQGGPGGFGVPGEFGGPEGEFNFEAGEMPEPPEGFNGKRPDNMPEPPDGFKGKGQRPNGFGGGNPPDGTPPEMPGEETSSSTPVVVEGADSITYTYQTTRGVTKTYYAKYLVDGTTLDLSGQTIEVTQSNEIAVLVVNGGTANLTNCTIIKSGDAAGASRDDDYNFYGINNAVVVLGSESTANLSGCTVNTTGKYANAVFASDDGTINITNGINISTTGSSARGLFASYGGTVKAEDGDVHISTKSIHCAALATDRGGGTVVVGTSENAKSSTLSTVAEDSPCIYSTGTITGWNITGNCTNGQALVVEGKNVVELNSCNLTGGRKNQGCIMLYQSSSGDAADEDASSSKSSLKITDCTFNVSNGADVIVVTHTSAAVTIDNCTFNTTGNENFISCKEIQWGTGAYLTVNAQNETLSGTVYTGDTTSKATINCKASNLKNANGSKGTATVNSKTL